MLGLHWITVTVLKRPKMNQNTMIPGEVELVMKSVDGLDGSMRASMAFDIENGKALELHYLSGAVVRIGEEVGLPTPVHRFFYDALAVWEKGAARYADHGSASCSVSPKRCLSTP